MKILLKLALLGMLSFNAHAVSMVCAGKNIYMSDVRNDFGTQPPIGALRRTAVYVYEGKVLMNEKFYVGVNKENAPAYEFSVGSRKYVASEGNQTSGSMTFKGIGEINKLPKDHSSDKIEIAKEEVLCTQSWALVQ